MNSVSEIEAELRLAKEYWLRTSAYFYFRPYSPERLRRDTKSIFAWFACFAVKILVLKDFARRR